jgi:hypothetical protein
VSEVQENEQLFTLTITATGEVHDKDGNLLDANQNIVGEAILTADEIRDFRQKGLL